MAHLVFSNGTTKRVPPKDAIRVALAMKYPERASEALRAYITRVASVSYDTGEPPQQAEMWWNK